MTEYKVDLFTLDDEYFQGWYSSDAIEEVRDWVSEDLEQCGGGHADIYDEDDNFIEDVDV